MTIRERLEAFWGGRDPRPDSLHDTIDQIDDLVDRLALALDDTLTAAS